MEKDFRMTADTPDHARALEVLQQDVRALAVLRDDILLMTSGKARALVALYAADVEEAIAYGNAMLATANADLSTEEWQAANEHWNKARAARRECLANVAKAVLP